jgi:leader peptidase (prepilin peptidase)/N-methyltransferase
LFGRQKLALTQDSTVIFSETALVLPGKEIPFEELFYRASDVIALHAHTVELVDRCYKDVVVRLSPALLQIGEEKFNPEQVPYLEAVSAEIVLPREAMGLGDVKFMGAIGAFLGWKAVLFSLMLSSVIGALVGVSLIVAGKRQWSSRLPYGPYIALASMIWLFGGKNLVEWWFSR